MELDLLGIHRWAEIGHLCDSIGKYGRLHVTQNRNLASCLLHVESHKLKYSQNRVISGWEILGDVSQTVLSLSHMVGLSTLNHVHMMTMGGAIVST